MDKIEARYVEWRETLYGREVFTLFERFALELFSQGETFGFQLVAERVRWEVKARGATLTDEERRRYRISNNFVALIGREIVGRHPALADVVRFRVRSVRGTQHNAPSDTVACSCCDVSGTTLAFEPICDRCLAPAREAVQTMRALEAATGNLSEYAERVNSL